MTGPRRYRLPHARTPVRSTVETTEGPVAVPSREHRWTALFLITEQ